MLAIVDGPDEGEDGMNNTDSISIELEVIGIQQFGS